MTKQIQLTDVVYKRVKRWKMFSDCNSRFEIEDKISDILKESKFGFNFSCILGAHIETGRSNSCENCIMYSICEYLD